MHHLVRDCGLSSTKNNLAAGQPDIVLTALPTIDQSLISRAPCVVQVRSFTFGSPRVGNRAFYDLFEQQTEGSWRFTHGRDVVPSLPPTCEWGCPEADACSFLQSQAAGRPRSPHLSDPRISFSFMLMQIRGCDCAIIPDSPGNGVV